MKKLKTYGFIAIGALVITSFVWANNSSSNSSTDLSISNIEALQASAVEFVCENIDDDHCSGEIHLPDGSAISSPTARGPLHMKVK